jgi:hypothetical protein
MYGNNISCFPPLLLGYENHVFQRFMAVTFSHDFHKSNHNTYSITRTSQTKSLTVHGMFTSRLLLTKYAFHVGSEYHKDHWFQRRHVRDDMILAVTVSLSPADISALVSTSLYQPHCSICWYWIRYEVATNIQYMEGSVRRFTEEKLTLLALC